MCKMYKEIRNSQDCYEDSIIFWRQSSLHHCWEDSWDFWETCLESIESITILTMLNILTTEPNSTHQSVSTSTKTLGATEQAAPSLSLPHPQAGTRLGTSQDVKPAIPGPSSAYQGLALALGSLWTECQLSQDIAPPTIMLAATAQRKAWQPIKLEINHTYKQSHSS